MWIWEQTETQILPTRPATYHIEFLLQFKNSKEIFQFSAEIFDKFISKLLQISATGFQSPAHVQQKLRATTVLWGLWAFNQRRIPKYVIIFLIWDSSRTHYKICFLSQPLGLFSVGAVDPLGSKSQLSSNLFAVLVPINCTSACSHIPRAKQKSPWDHIAI